MLEKSNSETSLTLLDRVCRSERDEEAWREFIERYGRRIFDWCLNRRLQAADAEDVTQEILVRMAKYLRTFEYDESKSFRGWLRRTTENAIKDFLSNQERGKALSGGSAILDLLSKAEARDDLSHRLAEAFDLELMDEAMARVRDRIAQNRWLAWHRTARQGRKAADVAAELNMKVATVYSARNQVQKMIQREIQLLEESGD